jgi:hypothetical protein
MTSAERTGFAVEFPADSPDFPNLFVHRFLLQETIPKRGAVGAILGHLGIFENTIEVGGADLKGGANVGKQAFYWARMRLWSEVDKPKKGRDKNGTAWVWRRGKDFENTTVPETVGPVFTHRFIHLKRSQRYGGADQAPIGHDSSARPCSEFNGQLSRHQKPEPLL